MYKNSTCWPGWRKLYEKEKKDGGAFSLPLLAKRCILVLMEAEVPALQLTRHWLLFRNLQYTTLNY